MKISFLSIFDINGNKILHECHADYCYEPQLQPELLANYFKLILSLYPKKIKTDESPIHHVSYQNKLLYYRRTSNTRYVILLGLESNIDIENSLLEMIFNSFENKFNQFIRRKIEATAFKQIVSQVEQTLPSFA